MTSQVPSHRISALAVDSHSMSIFAWAAVPILDDVVYLQAALGQDGVVIGQDGFQVTIISNGSSLSLQWGSAVYNGFLDLAVAPDGVLGQSILDQMHIGIDIKHTDAQKAAFRKGSPLVLGLQAFVMRFHLGCSNNFYCVQRDPLSTKYSPPR